MAPQLRFSLTLVVLLALILWLSGRYNMLKDQSTAQRKPYSYSRVQLAWWSWILLSCIISLIWITGKIPTLPDSVLALLGIGGLTTGLARAIDTSDSTTAKAAVAAGNANAVNNLSVNFPSQGFFLDILSDDSGVSIHRLQSFLFNLSFGVYFLYAFVNAIGPLQNGSSSDGILPIFTAQQLGLLGVSNATYLGLKSAENK
jgi:hypothetical protein